MGRLVASFKDTKNALNSRNNSSIRSITSYRRMVFSVIQNMSGDNLLRGLVIEGLDFICHDDSPESTADMKGTIDNVLTFLMSSFDCFLLDNETARANEENLKKIVQLVQLLSLKSEAFLEKVVEGHGCFQYFVDRVITFAKSFQGENPAVDVFEEINEIIVKSQFVCKIYDLLYVEITELKYDSIDHGTNYSFQFTQYLENISSAASVSLKLLRNEIKLLMKEKITDSKHIEMFKSSSIMYSMVQLCNFDNFTQCSHVLKLFLLFGEQPLLCDAIVQCYTSQLVSVFLATMRSDVVSIESMFAKYWLLRNVYDNVKYRHPIFIAEGCVLETVAVLRSVDLETEGFLSVLQPSRESPTFLDMSLTNSQILQHFGNVLQRDDSILKRQQAFAVLQIFAEGLILAKCSSLSSVRCSLIESGVLFGLVNAIGIVDECDKQHSCNEMATSLLCKLVSDKVICENFLVEPLGILQCLANSCDQFSNKSSVIESFLRVLEVVVVDEDNHVRLFDSHTMKDLENFIKDTLSILPKDGVNSIRRCLNIFHEMSSSVETVRLMGDSNMTDFLCLLLLHDDHDVVQVVSSILNRLQSQPSPEKWKSLFNSVENE